MAEAFTVPRCGEPGLAASGDGSPESAPAREVQLLKAAAAQPPILPGPATHGGIQLDDDGRPPRT
jgi:hypothetical protein